MYRLHGQDAAWLYRETLTTPMHTLKIFLVSLAGDQELDFSAVHDSIPRLLHEVPMLRQRPVFVPFGLHHPVMIEDPEFDLDYHLNRVAIPTPGGMRELEDVIAQIASHPLDQTRPLWQFFVLEGMADGRIVLVQKIHHTLADGMASVNFIMRVWQSAYHEAGSVAPSWQPEAMPSRARLIKDALLDHLKYDIGNLPSFFKAIYRSFWALKKHAAGTDSPNLRSMNGELTKTRWNRALSSKRSFATAQLDLEAMKSLKNKLQGTLNDVVLAVTAGAIRNFLSSHKELPTEPLLVTIPVSADDKGSTREFGNHTAVMVSRLHVEIADPLQRFQAIREANLQSKAELDVIGRETFGLMAHYVPPLIQQRIAESAYHKQIADSGKFMPPANLSVSNVPGPSKKFSALGNTVEDLYSAGPLVDGMGLNITVWSYAGNMNVTLVGCMKALPDLHDLADGFQAALAELQQAAAAA
jgi:diacylglycerol O-acyltransferase